MRRLALGGLTLLYCCVLGLGFYELTAKSPRWLGAPLPGWTLTFRAEAATRWNPPTGCLPLDRFLHEGEEAVRFFGLLGASPDHDRLLLSSAAAPAPDDLSGP